MALNAPDHEAPNDSAYSAMFSALYEKNTIAKTAFRTNMSKTLELRILTRELLDRGGGLIPKIRKFSRQSCNTFIAELLYENSMQILFY